VSAMIRKQIYIAGEQDTALKAQAKRLGVTESELIRRGISLQLTADDEAARRREAWSRYMAWSREWQSLGPVPGGRTWTRDGIYDES
jgi:hypothetical protein